MTIKSELQAAAVELFDTFESIQVNATYKQQSASYSAGGNLTQAATEYSIRLIRDTRRATLSLASDIPRDAKKFMMLVAELPVRAQAKDKIVIDGVERSIIAVEDDPGDVVATLYVG